MKKPKITISTLALIFIVMLVFGYFSLNYAFYKTGKNAKYEKLKLNAKIELLEKEVKEKIEDELIYDKENVEYNRINSFRLIKEIEEYIDQKPEFKKIEFSKSKTKSFELPEIKETLMYETSGEIFDMQVLIYLDEQNSSVFKKLITER